MEYEVNYDMKNVTWYNRNKANHFRFSTDAEVLEEKQRKRKLIWALRKQREAEAEAYENEHAKGYCPKCHCLLPLNGICNNCD